MNRSARRISRVDIAQYAQQSTRLEHQNQHMFSNQQHQSAECCSRVWFAWSKVQGSPVRESCFESPWLQYMPLCAGLRAHRWRIAWSRSRFKEASFDSALLHHSRRVEPQCSRQSSDCRCLLAARRAGSSAAHQGDCSADGRTLKRHSFTKRTLATADGRRAQAAGCRRCSSPANHLIPVRRKPGASAALGPFSGLYRCKIVFQNGLRGCKLSGCGRPGS